MDSKSILQQKNYPDCAKEALNLIRNTYTRVGKQELTHLAFEYIFLYDYNKDQNTWVKVTIHLKLKLYQKFEFIRSFVDS